MERIFLSPPHMSGNELKYIGEVFESNYIAPLGPMMDKFEASFCKITHSPKALALSSGTAALHLALRYFGVTAGDIVMCSDLTFIGGVSPITFVGATPYFVDSDFATWNMDPVLLEEGIKDAIATHGKKPKAIVLVHIYGIPADLDKILAVAKKYEIPLIEDCAEALGASYKGNPLGSHGDASIFSFNGNKILTTSGGGMLTSPHPELIAKCRFWSTQARDPFPYYEHTEIGYNYRMSNVLSAIGVAQLEVLSDRVASRKRNYEFYREHLSLEGIGFSPYVEFGEPNFWLSCITLDPKVFKVTPEQVRLYLEKDNIESRPTWKPMHMQPVFKDAPRKVNNVGSKIFYEGLCLPSGSSMKVEDLHRVVKNLKTILLG